MNRISFLVALGSVLLLGARPAFAEKDGTANEEGTPYPQPQTRGRRARQAEYQRYDRNLRYDRNNGPNEQYGRWEDRGGGPDHQYRRGDRLPGDYRGRSYVVENWRSHNLSEPPRGHRWVQTGADYLLVAIATGLIVQVLLGN